MDPFPLSGVVLGDRVGVAENPGGENRSAGAVGVIDGRCDDSTMGCGVGQVGLDAERSWSDVEVLDGGADVDTDDDGATFGEGDRACFADP